MHYAFMPHHVKLSDVKATYIFAGFLTHPRDRCRSTSTCVTELLFSRHMHPVKLSLLLCKSEALITVLTWRTGLSSRSLHQEECGRISSVARFFGSWWYKFKPNFIKHLMSVQLYNATKHRKVLSCLSKMHWTKYS